VHCRQSGTRVFAGLGRRSARRRASARHARGVWGRAPRAVSRLDQAWFAGGWRLCRPRGAPPRRCEPVHGTEVGVGSLARPVPPHPGTRRARPATSRCCRDVLGALGRVQDRRRRHRRWLSVGLGGMRAACHAANHSLSDTACRFARGSTLTSRGRHGTRPLGALKGSCRQRPDPSPHGLGGQHFGNQPGSDRRQTGK
jgi:hypothetical protein